MTLKDSDKYGHLFRKSRWMPEEIFEDVKGNIDQSSVGIVRWSFCDDDMFQHIVINRAPENFQTILNAYFEIGLELKERAKNDRRYWTVKKTRYWDDPSTGEVIACKSNDPYLVYDQNGDIFRLVKAKKDEGINVLDSISVSQLKKNIEQRRLINMIKKLK